MSPENFFKPIKNEKRLKRNVFSNDFPIIWLGKLSTPINMRMLKFWMSEIKIQPEKQLIKWVKWPELSARPITVSSQDASKLKLSIITFFTVFLPLPFLPFKMKTNKNWSHSSESSYHWKSSLVCLQSQHFCFCFELMSTFDKSVFIVNFEPTEYCLRSTPTTKALTFLRSLG